jgi:hypothetical protein
VAAGNKQVRAMLGSWFLLQQSRCAAAAATWSVSPDCGMLVAAADGPDQSQPSENHMSDIVSNGGGVGSEPSRSSCNVHEQYVARLLTRAAGVLLLSGGKLSFLVGTCWLCLWLPSHRLRTRERHLVHYCLRGAGQPCRIHLVTLCCASRRRFPAFDLRWPIRTPPSIATALP